MQRFLFLPKKTHKEIAISLPGVRDLMRMRLGAHENEVGSS